jgi:hypothetical protein
MIAFRSRESFTTACIASGWSTFIKRTCGKSVLVLLLRFVCVLALGIELARGLLLLLFSLLVVDSFFTCESVRQVRIFLAGVGRPGVLRRTTYIGSRETTRQKNRYKSVDVPVLREGVWRPHEDVESEISNRFFFFFSLQLFCMGI